MMDTLPGKKLTPVTNESLSASSEEWQRNYIEEQRKKGIPEEQILATLKKGSLFFHEEQLLEDAPHAKEKAGGPEEAFPEFKPTDQGGLEIKKKHPLLEKLETAFGVKKLQIKTVELGGFVFSFRPPNWRDYEWMMSNVPVVQEGTTYSVPSIQVSEVVSGLAAIDGTPVYLLMGLNVTGRFIPDTSNPPMDIRRSAQDAMLEWIRQEIGLWELIPALHRKYNEIFEKDREELYPLYQTLRR